MPQLLLELFSEEIPARMQAQAAKDLERLAREKLAAEGLLPEALTAFAGPRRLTLAAEGLAAAQAERHEERKGPRVGSPDQAIEGFLRSTGLTRDQLTERDGLYFAHIHKAGRPTAEIVAEMVDAIVRNFPWPKSMVSGVSKLRWVRPLQRILCVFDGEVVPFEIDGHVSGDLTEGHRFMGSGQAFAVKDFDSYADGLARNFVVLDPHERRERIMDAAQTLCFARNFELVKDDGLLDEVAGLAEWPTPVMGDMDPAFLDLPPEVIRTSMRVHQRFFAVRDPATGFLVPHFITVANIEATDGGATIATGNSRVLAARLADARFFWNEDQRVPLEARLEKLKGVTFHAKLGTMYERVERITALAGELAPLVGASPERARQAARLCKADLGTGMVGEFPELQGIMGAYYARAEGLPDDVADAIASHYRPAGPSDDVPTGSVAVAVALADKLDTLVSFFAIDEKPTGSRDPFALRRAALGVIRTLLQTRARVPLREVLNVTMRRVALIYDAVFADDQCSRLEMDSPHADRMLEYIGVMEAGLAASPWSIVFEKRLGLREFKQKYAAGEIAHNYSDKHLGDLTREALDLFGVMGVLKDHEEWDPEHWSEEEFLKTRSECLELVDDAFAAAGRDLLAFFADRLKVLLRDQGQRHDLVDAVFALGDDDMVRIVAKVEALGAFLGTEDGANLLAGYKRAVNILKAEEKKGPLPTGEPLAMAGASTEEAGLVAAVTAMAGPLDACLTAEDFAGAMGELARLRGPVDAFFDKVLVNSDVPAERDNRLRLLAKVRDAMGRVADFGQVTG